MNWEDERYVRLYTRDTGDWCALSWDAQALLMQLLRKADRAGVIQLGKRGRAALPLLLCHANEAERIDAALSELTEDGCVELHGGNLVIPNFTKAQESKQSDKQRQAESRAKRLAQARDSVVPTTNASQPVTDGHTESRIVTPNCAVPSRAEPAKELAPGSSTASAPAQGSLLPEEPKPKRARQPRATKGDPSLVALIWRAYSAAHEASPLYGTKPPWNDTVGGMLANLGRRLGKDAPEVAAFYVSHPDPYYAKKGHTVGPLVADAEKLHGEWKRGRHIQPRAGNLPQPERQPDILSTLTRKKS